MLALNFSCNFRRECEACAQFYPPSVCTNADRNTGGRKDFGRRNLWTRISASKLFFKEIHKKKHTVCKKKLINKNKKKQTASGQMVQNWTAAERLTLLPQLIFSLPECRDQPYRVPAVFGAAMFRCERRRTSGGVRGRFHTWTELCGHCSQANGSFFYFLLYFIFLFFSVFEPIRR